MNQFISRMVAGWVSVKLKGYYFGVTTDPQEIKEIYRLRYKVYCQELKFINPKQMQDGLEIDEYDQYAIHFVAKKSNRIVGTLRIIPNSVFGIPSEKFVNLKKYIPEKSKYGEVSRFILEKNFRKSFVSVGLMCKMVTYALRNHFDFLVITNSIIHEKRYHKLGFYRIEKPYVYPLVNDKYLAVTMINNIRLSSIMLPKTQPVFDRLVHVSKKNVK